MNKNTSPAAAAAGSVQLGGLAVSRMELGALRATTAGRESGAPKGMKVGTGAKLFRSNNTGIRALVGSPNWVNLMGTGARLFLCPERPESTQYSHSVLLSVILGTAGR